MRAGDPSKRAACGIVTGPVGPVADAAAAFSSFPHDSIRVGDPAPFGFSSAGRSGIVGR
jgi:hypothetical protein